MDQFVYNLETKFRRVDGAKVRLRRVHDECAPKGWTIRDTRNALREIGFPVGRSNSGHTYTGNLELDQPAPPPKVFVEDDERLVLIEA
jgi:hypothetical protein